MGIWDFFKDRRWEQLDKVLEESFGRVKRDTYNIAQWLKYLRQKDIQNEIKHQKIDAKFESHDEKIRQLQLEIGALKMRIEDIKNQPKISPFPDQVRTKSGLKSEPAPKISENYSKKIIAQMRPVKKEYVMQQILNLIAKESYTTKQIETIIVQEKTLCGRTAFYDYLKELKHKNLVTESKGPLKRILVLKSR